MIELEKNFIEAMDGFLNHYKAIEFEWKCKEIKNPHCCLKKNSSTGFDIEIIASNPEIVLFINGIDFPFDPETNQSTDDFINDILGLVRDMVTENMRLILFETNNRIYKWKLESKTNGIWKQEFVSRLIFWNYFGKKTTRILQNSLNLQNNNLQ